MDEKRVWNPPVQTLSAQKLPAEIRFIQRLRMRLNDYGRIVESTWFDLVNHVDGIKLHEFIVMPNHVHGIIKIVKRGQ
jgi:REP element-mobilizing transposase RayT